MAFANQNTSKETGNKNEQLQQSTMLPTNQTLNINNNSNQSSLSSSGQPIPQQQPQPPPPLSASSQTQQNTNNNPNNNQSNILQQMQLQAHIQQQASYLAQQARVNQQMRGMHAHSMAQQQQIMRNIHHVHPQYMNIMPSLISPSTSAASLSIPSPHHYPNPANQYMGSHHYAPPSHQQHGHSGHHTNAQQSSATHNTHSQQQHHHSGSALSVSSSHGSGNNPGVGGGGGSIGPGGGGMNKQYGMSMTPTTATQSMPQTPITSMHSTQTAPSVASLQSFGSMTINTNQMMNIMAASTQSNEHNPQQLQDNVNNNGNANANNNNSNNSPQMLNMQQLNAQNQLLNRQVANMMNLNNLMNARRNNNVINNANKFANLNDNNPNQLHPNIANNLGGVNLINNNKNNSNMTGGNMGGMTNQNNNLALNNNANNANNMLRNTTGVGGMGGNMTGGGGGVNDEKVRGGRGGGGGRNDDGGCDIDGPSAVLGQPPNSIIVNVSSNNKYGLRNYLVRARRILRLAKKCRICGIGSAVSVACEVTEVLKRERVAKVVEIITDLVEDDQPRPSVEIIVTRGRFAHLVSDFRRRKVIEVFEKKDTVITGFLSFNFVRQLDLAAKFKADPYRTHQAQKYLQNLESEAAVNGVNLPTFIHYCSIIIHPLLLEYHFKMAIAELGGYVDVHDGHLPREHSPKKVEQLQQLGRIDPFLKPGDDIEFDPKDFQHWFSDRDRHYRNSHHSHHHSHHHRQHSQTNYRDNEFLRRNENRQSQHSHLQHSHLNANNNTNNNSGNTNVNNQSLPQMSSVVSGGEHSAVIGNENDANLLKNAEIDANSGGNMTGNNGNQSATTGSRTDDGTHNAVDGGSRDNAVVSDAIGGGDTDTMILNVNNVISNDNVNSEAGVMAPKRVIIPENKSVSIDDMDDIDEMDNNEEFKHNHLNEEDDGSSQVHASSDASKNTPISAITSIDIEN